MVFILSNSFIDALCLSSFIFLFYADELVTLVVRLKDAQNILRPHRRHFYQILANEMKIDHWKISIGYGIIQLIIGVSVLLLRPFGFFPVSFILIIFFSGFILANCIVRIKISKALI
jgi:Fuc2NAc and GlcNAc transferase